MNSLLLLSLSWPVVSDRHAGWDRLRWVQQSVYFLKKFAKSRDDSTSTLLFPHVPLLLRLENATTLIIPSLRENFLNVV
jgi:hypothetical protein